MKYSRYSWALLAYVCAWAVTMQSCVEHKLPTPEGLGCSSLVSYAEEVLPIINTHCAIVGDGGCHNGANGSTRDWRVFTNVQSHAAEIKNRITRTPGTAGFMPRIGTLTDQQIQVISCWVDQGAPDN